MFALAQYRLWAQSIGIIIGFSAGYLLISIMVYLIISDAAASALIAGLTTASAIIFWRREKLVSLLQDYTDSRDHQLGSPLRFWTFVLIAVLLAWFTGQVIAELLYDHFGSSNYDQISANEQSSHIAMLLISALLVAPLIEEALLRGMAYPLLRRHWPPLAAAFVTAAIFAIVHGNLIQAALVFPLGMVLAFVYEHTQRLREVVVIHIGFNMLSALVPSSVISAMNHLGAAAALVVVLGMTLVAIHPSAHKPAEPGD